MEETGVEYDSDTITELTPIVNTTILNLTDANPTKGNVADVKWDKWFRIYVLYAEIILGIIGCLLVLLWLWHNRRRRSRVNLLILHLTAANILVILFACTSQIIWEYFDYIWYAGPVMCKLVKFLQSFSMMASTNMLVVLSVDRHQAITAPLSSPFPVMKLTGIGWGIAGVLSLPQFYIFRHGIRDGAPRCESIFRDVPPSHRQAYLTFVLLVTLLIPLAILTVCYVRIFWKIAVKAREGKSGNSEKSGKVLLQSTPSSSLPKAKIKTLKMTVVIVSVYIICGLPYPFCEMIFAFGDFEMVHPIMWSIFGGMAVANSAANSWVFLAFNAEANKLCKCCINRAGRKDHTGSICSEFNTHSTEVTTKRTDHHTHVHLKGDYELKMKDRPKVNGNNSYAIISTNQREQRQ
ncbi:unnamed protein product [Owenia fusiformis]|uniref:Uncharacterized protein n=1 Tax=Owenia fusiformis TaxID=6347 RepID=A0A8J1TVY1_OWEFU|nr:unnamed protein product [Owenia fusiformis]